MNAIEQWKLNGSPYNEGVLLYASIPMHNKILLKNFQKKQSVQLHEKLKYELSKIDNSEKAKTVPNVQKQIKTEQNGTFEPKRHKKELVHYIEQQQIKDTTKQALYFHELPEQLRPVLLEANALFKEMCLLKVQLNELPDEAEEEALLIQNQISNKRKRNALCWEKLDYWKANKLLPKAPKGKFDELSPANLVKQEQYLFASISKMKSRLNENKLQLAKTTDFSIQKKLQRSIIKQESSLIAKNEELITIKRLINGN